MTTITVAPVRDHGDTGDACPSTDARWQGVPFGVASDIPIGLLGVGQVGSAVARLAAGHFERARPTFRVTAGLVRDVTSRERRTGAPLTTDPQTVFDSGPRAIVEALGGLEPARTLVLEALARGVPVVTANKSLIAHHGDELLEAATAVRVPLRYEATVIAGLPFLGTFARRPLASKTSTAAIVGIVNGTTNFILSNMQHGGADFATALKRAQSLGFAEPDPSKDVDGVDAVEKLAILVRQFVGISVPPDRIETVGIREITAADLAHAADLGGTIKPVVYARPDGPGVSAFAGPAFLPATHPLAGLRGACNGICLTDYAERELCLTGPGAGPDVTAITILDDVIEAITEHVTVFTAARTGRAAQPATGWLLRVASPLALSTIAEIGRVLAAHGAHVLRTSARDGRNGGEVVWILTHAASRDAIERARAALSDLTGGATFAVRALGID